MKILSLNTGSSSIKFKIFNMSDESVLLEGVIEKTAEENFHIKVTDYLIGVTQEMDLYMPNHSYVITVLLEQLQLRGYIDVIDAIGHRIAHGADKFEDAVFVDDRVIEKIASLNEIAPLHNPAIVKSIREVMRKYPEIPNVAVFDTVFHKTLPAHAYMYALPMVAFKKYGVRKYGFHGISCKFVAETAAKYLGIDFEHFNCIYVHLGSGCSLTSIENGKSIDTTMGFTPMDGLMMSTRCGSIDVGVVEYMNHRGFSIEKIMKMLNRKSGLLGIAGTHDMRRVVVKMKDGDKNATLAFQMFVTRVRKEIASSFALMARVEALIFTGGIGENQPSIREKICERMEHLGIELDLALNKETKGNLNTINSASSKIKILVVPTNEELEIARETQAVLEGGFQ